MGDASVVQTPASAGGPALADGSAVTARAAPAGDTAGQYLSFLLGEDNFALDVTEVEVVLEWTHVTRVPKAPEYMRGVINHRGSVVPVVDLKLKFGMGPTDAGEGTSIVVMGVAYENDRVQVGILADGVEEVVDIDPALIEPPPEYGSRRAGKFLKGIAKRDGGFVLLLDMDRVFAPEELLELSE